jgi:hypothetical protein
MTGASTATGGRRTTKPSAPAPPASSGCPPDTSPLHKRFTPLCRKRQKTASPAGQDQSTKASGNSQASVCPLTRGCWTKKPSTSILPPPQAGQLAARRLFTTLPETLQSVQRSRLRRTRANPPSTALASKTYPNTMQLKGHKPAENPPYGLLPITAYEVAMDSPVKPEYDEGRDSAYIIPSTRQTDAIRMTKEK